MSAPALIVVPLTTFTHTEGDVMADDLDNDGLENADHWRDTVEARLGTLETKVGEEARLRAAMDEDISRLHIERNLLQALHDTQSEHTATLRDHTAQLHELRVVQLQHTATLNEHTAILNEHTATLNEHTATLNEHTAILNDHTATLNQHTTQLGELKVGIQLIVTKLDTLIARDD